MSANVTVVNYETNTSDPEREASAHRRRSNLESKLLHRTDTPASRTGTLVPLPELQAVRVAQGISSASQKTEVNHYGVFFETRRSDMPKTVYQMLGTAVIFFPENETMLGQSGST